MALSKVSYTDYQTVVTAANLNAIQDEIISTTGYADCNTAANVAAKSCTLLNFKLDVGSTVKVHFSDTNTASNPTLNINSTGAKPIVRYSTTAAGTTELASWMAGAVVEFMYDGQYYVMVGNNRSILPTDVGVGTLANLTTTDKTDLVSAINEVDAHADTNASDITTLNQNVVKHSSQSLTAAQKTQARSNISAAEASEAKVLVLSSSSFSSLPQTITNANITSDMVCVHSELSNPSAQTADWTVSTTSGSLSVSGSISGSTTVKLYMMKSR